MDISEFKSGTWRRTTGYKYFLPEKINHSFFWEDESINEMVEKASLRLGELNSFARFVPDPDMFIKMHVFKEAVLSSHIEGTRTNIDEAVVPQKDLAPERRDDWQEVNNYVEAMNYAISELDRLPLSNRMIKNVHRILLTSVRGQNKNPGEFRTGQNWIGGATLDDAMFVPPAPQELPELLGDLERFLHNDEIRLPHLIRIAIAHYQFETIHPFDDGNGRTGRLLITLYLVSNGVLDLPLLYLSEFFDKNRTLYFDNLERVRVNNDLGQWFKFFLAGVIATAENATSTLHKIIGLKNEIERNKIPKMGKRQKNAVILFSALFSQPRITINDVRTITGLSPKAANDLVTAFMEAGILFEQTGYQRNRVFSFEEYLKLFR
ncbi:filamentation induced by cAMP protein Fic [Dehalogenimonas lykanthroporepellens BL-DC-9]|nr:filamentation induced by cAMP protein Fic [Dehalogenimonas lykanthroporepellens BL-DC-9]